MDGFKARTDKKRDLIIQSALLLFKVLSPSKVSIREIAAKAQVSVVTIYNYFGSKEGLMLEVVRSVLATQLRLAEEITQSNDPADKKIARLVFTKTELLSQFHPDFISFIMNDPSMTKLIEEEFLSRTYELIKDFIHQAKSEGAFSKELPDEMIMKVIELYRKDISSENSILFSSQEEIKSHETILKILLYGIAGYKNH
ncbi:TetR/AcrR family transcriptional regulator [Metabacillus indicus]|uniref:TetR/AcrR family transcriptional regulator n=1 Tax=Metabacillus indicus TaxID=246786 RepID=UPI002A08BE7A|nr:TetR/AcrR family transcriptional regulator [Metabacillus indicus]MDX8291557.1 TetR/AcrR family transcriptional regulator [Metabacillus indicus]